MGVIKRTTGGSKGYRCGMEISSRNSPPAYGVSEVSKAMRQAGGVMEERIRGDSVQRK
jgi:hypothetical protein